MSDPLPSDQQPAPGRRLRGPRTRGNRVFLAIMAGLATAAVIVMLDGLWAGRQMFRGVASARSALGEGAVAVVTGDPEAAQPFFEDAGDDAASAVDAAGRPSIRLLSLLPIVGDDIAAVQAVAVASEETAEAGLAMVDAANTLGWHDLRLPATEAIGSVDIPTLRAATPKLNEVAKHLGIAAAQLQAAHTGRLLGPVATGFDDALETLDRRARVALNARDLALFLPKFLGAGEERRYLVAVQTLGRPQGTGGMVDLVGTLEARGGELALASPLAPAGDAFNDATLSPDGPTAAQALLLAAGDSGLGEFDGVILLDSVWLQDACWVTGSVEVEDRTLPLTMDDAADALEIQALETTSETDAAATRASWANSILESYLTKRPSTEAFAIGSAKVTAERHLILYSTDEREQALLTRLGATGTYDVGQNPVSVIWNSLVENHASVFTHRTTTHSVIVEPDGSARVHTVVDLVNAAADTPPSVVLGLPIPATVEEPGGVAPVGGFAAEVRVALPSSADKITVETSVPSETEVVREGNEQFAVATLATDPGDSISLIINYSIDRAVPDDARQFRTVVFPQPTLDPGLVKVRLDAPGGATVSEAQADMTRAGTTASYAGEPSAPIVLWIRW